MQLSVDYQGRRGGGGVSRGYKRREEEGSVCVGGRVCVRSAKRQVGTQMAGKNKSIKANLPRFCNSFSMGDSMKREEPWI